MNIVFFGTHDFAETVLADLLADPFFTVTAVITQPDRPVGRKNIVTPPPVKVLALAHNLPVFQPETLKNFSVTNLPKPDYGIVSQYGNLIPEEILNWPVHGMLNTHTSLLPKYRGASPVQAAMLNNDPETGLTIMQLDKGMDTGPILLQEKITIQPDDTYPIVENNLAKIAAKNLKLAIEGLANGSIKPIKQDNSLASTCGKLDRDSGHINWTDSAHKIYTSYRAFFPWPGVWTTWSGKRVKLLELGLLENETLAPGQTAFKNNQLLVGTGRGALEIKKLQLEGKNALTAKEYLAGYPGLKDTKLG